MAQEYISTQKAKQELGDKAYFAFCRWLRERGDLNLTSEGESKYKHEIFATKDQLNKFIGEQIRVSKGNLPITALWGQTREILRGYVPTKRKAK